MKTFILLSALFAVSLASPTVSGDFGSVGIQGEQTVRGALNTVSSYQKAVNTGTSQSFVSRTDYTNNPGVIAHPFAAVGVAPVAPVAAAYHAPLAAAYHAPLGAAYHAPIAPVAAAYHAPIGAAAYYH